MNDKKKNIFGSLFLTIITCAVIIGITPAFAWADSGIEYIDESGLNQVCQDCQSIDTVLAESNRSLPGGWYYVSSGEHKFEGRVSVSGDVYLILCDGAHLVLPSGVTVPRADNGGITIYAQSEGEEMGALSCSAYDRRAGIGGDKDIASGPITINGGRIYAQGGKYAAGIGGGDEAATGPITINRGEVNTTGGYYGAGIGSGDQSSPADTICITGGKVVAHGGYDAAGIGSGNESHAGEILISNAEVTSTGGYYGAGIGGGDRGNGGKITIDNGIINATSGGMSPADSFAAEIVTSDVAGAGIGGGRYGNAGSITIKDGTIHAQGMKRAAGIGSGGENNVQEYDGKDSEGCKGGAIRIYGGQIDVQAQTIWGDTHEPTHDGGASIGCGAESFGCLVEISGGDIKTKVSSYGGRTDYAGCITTPGYGGAAIGNGTDARSEGIARIKGTEQDGPKIFIQTIKRYFSGGHYPGVVAIGALGVSKDSRDCTVEWDYPCGKVRTGGNAVKEETVPKDKRLSAIRGHSYIWIEPCDHPDRTYTGTDKGHSFVCENCDYQSGTEAHQYEKGVYLRNKREHWQVCTLCGYEDREEHAYDARTGRCDCGLKSDGTVEKMNCTVTYDTDGGTEINPEVLLRGTSAQRPEDPVKEGYVFGGWRLVQGEEIEKEDYNFADPVITDITLRAVWNCAHEMESFPAKDPVDCETPGNMAYWQCKKCGKYFADAEGTTECKKEGDWIIPGDHDFGDWEGVSDVQHKRICKKNPDHVEIADHGWDGGQVTTEPTQEADGEITFTCVGCGAVKKESIAKLDGNEYIVSTRRVGGGGNVYASEVWGKGGTKVILRAEAAKGFAFSTWQIEGSGASCSDESSAETTLTIGDADVIATAIFVPSIDGEEVELSETSFTYNGDVQRPEIVSVGGRAFSEDYCEVEWSDENSTNPGIYTVTITGKGELTGTTKAHYEINPPWEVYNLQVTTSGKGNATASQARGREGEAVTLRAKAAIGYIFGGWQVQGEGAVLENPKSAITTLTIGKSDVAVTAVFLQSINRAEVGLSKTAFTYNGKVQKPVIKSIDGRAFSEDSYTVVWSNKNSTNAGTYTVKITGKGEFAGTTVASYRIDKAANPMTVKAKTVKLKAKKLKKKKQTIKRTKAITIKGARGKLTYTKVKVNKKKKIAKKFTVNKKTGKITVKKGVKKGTYRVTIRVTAAGTADYKPLSRTVTVKIRVR